MLLLILQYPPSGIQSSEVATVDAKGNRVEEIKREEGGEGEGRKAGEGRWRGRRENEEGKTRRG